MSGKEQNTLASPILTGVSKGAVAFITLFNLYSADQPTDLNTQIVEYTDEKVIYFTHTDPDLILTPLKNHLNDLTHWYSLVSKLIEANLYTLALLFVTVQCI